MIWACKKLQWGANQAGLFQYYSGNQTDELTQCKTNKPAQNVMIRTFGCHPKFRPDPEVGALDFVFVPLTMLKTKCDSTWAGTTLDPRLLDQS